MPITAVVYHAPILLRTVFNRATQTVEWATWLPALAKAALS